jgi:steroid 5-alpha reductase family enzyme
MLRFKSNPKSEGQVMNQGLWRYSRHPNYFGEALLWWGIYLIALAASAPFWVLVSPIFMSFLLLRVSGVPLLEEDLKHRKPDYRDYIETTSSFWPRPPRRAS